MYNQDNSENLDEFGIKMDIKMGLLTEGDTEKIRTSQFGGHWGDLPFSSGSNLWETSDLWNPMAQELIWSKFGPESCDIFKFLILDHFIKACCYIYIYTYIYIYIFIYYNFMSGGHPVEDLLTSNIFWPSFRGRSVLKVVEPLGADGAVSETEESRSRAVNAPPQKMPCVYSDNMILWDIMIYYDILWYIMIYYDNIMIISWLYYR